MKNTDVAGDIVEPAWRFLDDRASVVVLRVDGDGTIVRANRYARTLIGRPLTGAAWHTIQIGFPGEPAFGEWLLGSARPRRLNVRTAAGVPQTLEFEVEPVAGGFVLFGQVNAGEQDRLRHEVLALNHELANLGRERALRNAELADLTALKNQFLAMAAHDLRKPAGLVLNYAEVLLDELKTDLSATHQGFLRTIERAARRMARLIDDFLDVSVIEAGHLRLDLRPARLDHIVDHAIVLVDRIAAERRIQVRRALDGSTPTWQVDEPKIEQVLTNLLGNAVEHSPDDAAVWVRSSVVDGRLRVEVADEGPGLDPAKRDALFQPFARGAADKPSGERSIGLGLTISKKIIEAHGGRMFVEAGRPNGTVVGFILPSRIEVVP